ALFPPNSKRDLPSRAATVVATDFPMAVDPVAETRATRGSAARAWPRLASPMISPDTPSGTSLASKTSATIRWHAKAERDAFSEGFQTQALPQTQATNAFQLQTATGKLKAEIIPTTPKGCHCSYILCIGLSECIVSPYNCLDKPTAKSQISIISCTSPRPS